MSFGHFSLTCVSVVTRLAIQDAIIVPTRSGSNVIGIGTILRFNDIVSIKLPSGDIQSLPRVPLPFVCESVATAKNVSLRCAHSSRACGQIVVEMRVLHKQCALQ